MADADFNRRRDEYHQQYYPHLTKEEFEVMRQEKLEKDKADQGKSDAMFKTSVQSPAFRNRKHHPIKHIFNNSRVRVVLSGALDEKDPATKYHQQTGAIMTSRYTEKEDIVDHFVKMDNAELGEFVCLSCDLEDVTPPTAEQLKEYADVLAELDVD
jgi:hypothetical protein